jgi:hypothetical protein
MSEVIAVYMGLDINKNMYGDKYSELPNGNTIFHKYIPSWDWIHEVWEKVMKTDTINYTYSQTKESLELTTEVKKHLCNNSILEAFTVLHDVIVFINKIKQDRKRTSQSQWCRDLYH